MLWDSEQPIKELPSHIRKYFLQEAKYLFEDLEENQLKVVLVPAPNPCFSGHKIRHIESKNPEWYRDLYKHHPNFKRTRSLRVLRRITSLQDRPYFIDNTPSPLPYRFHYDTLYRQLIYTILTQGFLIERKEIRPVPEVRAYFGFPPLEDIIEQDIIICADGSTIIEEVRVPF